MINLAGRKDCDEHIKMELRRCIIPAVSCEKNVGEVGYTVFGQLNGFTFKRAWYYYIVDGKLPLSLAKRLYDDPCGENDIRVDGHCCCPAPERNYVTWFAPDGKQILQLEQKLKAEKYLNSSLKDSAQRVLNEHYFSDDPAKDFNAKPYVTLYHIDSELGLRLFADAIRNLLE
jgi:hypothetical protein